MHKEADNGSTIPARSFSLLIVGQNFMNFYFQMSYFIIAGNEAA
jgi:hypothetical protein